MVLKKKANKETKTHFFLTSLFQPYKLNKITLGFQTFTNGKVSLEAMLSPRWVPSPLSTSDVLRKDHGEGRSW